MIPKEKALELFNKMDIVVGGGNYDAKEYALIAVNEVIEVCSKEISNCSDMTYFYWQEVKQEIEKL